MTAWLVRLTGLGLIFFVAWQTFDAVREGVLPPGFPWAATSFVCLGVLMATGLPARGDSRGAVWRAALAAMCLVFIALWRLAV